MENKQSTNVHHLNLTYEEYLNNNKTIINTKIDKYIVYGQLGSGAFGAVYKGMNDITKKIVAIKVLDLKAVEAEPNPRVKLIRRRLCQTQSQLMMLCNSDNVVKCYDVYQNSALKIMVLQYCNGGQLKQQIKEKKKIPQAEAIMILKQIINGIAELHTHNIIHRDLKAENILSHNGIYKIADLGFSKQVQDQGDIKHTTLGTITTMAPQVIEKKPYGLKADIWSIGIIFFQMIFGKEPYSSLTGLQMSKQIATKKILTNEQFEFNGHKASTKVTSFLKEVLTIDKHQRMGWKQLLGHPLFVQKDPRLSNEFRLNYELKKPKINITDQIQNNVRKPQHDEHSPTKNESPQKKNNGVKIERLDVQTSKAKFKEIKDNKEDQLFIWVKETHLECLKTELIFNQIFIIIEHYKLLNLTEREVVQFMYLILTRCLNNISVINNRIEHQQNTSLLLAKLHDNVRFLYDKITTAWNKYSKLLTQVQNKIGSIISDRFTKIFKSKSLETKDKFLTGIEKMYYTKEEQVLFTSEEYIGKIRADIRPEPSIYSKSIKNYLSHYEEINLIKLEDLKKRTFQEYVQMILQ